MYLHIVCVFQELHILVPVCLMLGDLVSKACDDWSVEPFKLAVGLGLVGCADQMVDFQKHSDSYKESRDEFQSVIGN